ncbi:MAG: hypothetical protein F4Y28_07195 [Acidimicrobiia bacterium]|nr:hypothetical protein [Acidimicrobiia bacterium]MYG58036.1 hypothetical protein [Acidimicrobiia bacterium]MYJ32525.1 hypothetical protein [Acidimicrobiia bacterium]
MANRFRLRGWKEQIAARKAPLEEDSEFEDDGEWPGWLKKLWWDLWPGSEDKPTDGLREPTPKSPYWLSEVGANSELVLNAARATRAFEENRLEQAVARAVRLLRTSLVLLVIGFASTGFLLNHLIDYKSESWTIYFLLVPSISALVFLVLSALQSLGVDRVGLGMAPRPGPIAEENGKSQFRVAAHEEVNAALFAKWTAEKKLDESNAARRNLSCAIVALISSGLVVLLSISLLQNSECQDRKIVDGVVSDHREC